MVTQIRSQLTVRSRLALVFAAAGLCILSLWALDAAVADASTAKDAAVGAVYTQTNDPAGNSVVVFDREADGTLTKREAVSTGGNGSTQSVGCGPGCPILDSTNAVVVSGDGKYVFAVNAGSNTVSSFRETGSGLKLVTEVPSGGDKPESLALHGDLLYVLNVQTANSNGTTGNIYGLTFNGAGRLTPVGSSQPLAHLAPPVPDSVPPGRADARAIDFKPNGKVIVVTELAGGFNEPGGPPGRINTFVVGSDGKAGPVVSHASSDGFPFGFAFDNNDHLIVTNVHDPSGTVPGSVSSYTLTDAGAVIPINTVPSGGVLPCWAVVSNDGRFAYVVNTGAGFPSLVTHFAIGANGALTPLSPSSGHHAGDFLRTDTALSSDSQYLYVLAPSFGPPGTNASHIDEYRRNADGSLTLIGSTPADANLGVGASGLAAR